MVVSRVVAFTPSNRNEDWQKFPAVHGTHACATWGLNIPALIGTVVANLMAVSRRMHAIRRGQVVSIRTTRLRTGSALSAIAHRQKACYAPLFSVRRADGT